MIVKSFEGGYDKNFSYLIWCNKTNIASLIDPSVDIAAIIDAIKKYKLEFKSIFITHSHHDHFSYLKDFINIYPKINIYINYKTEFQHSLVSYLKNNQKIAIGNEQITCISTPGHFYDSMCFWNKKHNILFTGDTVFVGRTGRVVSHKSNIEDLYHSIYNIILKLPLETIIYPGHNYGNKDKISIKENKQISNFFNAQNFRDFEKIMEDFEKNRKKS